MRLFSMRFAIGLLILLALVCILGSLIPQGEEPGYYEMQYGPFFGKNGCISCNH